MKKTELYASLITRGVLKTPVLIRAFEKIDRVDFVAEGLEFMAYEDRPLPILSSQTISQPYTVAFMLELLEVNANDVVMDLGSGSGWTTALLASIAEYVDAVERHTELLAFSQKNLEKYNFKNISLHQAESSLGLKGRLFDKILVSCAAESMPNSLLEQLKPGGIMVIPIKNSIFKVRKREDGSLALEEHPGFVFVPLIEDDL